MISDPSENFIEMLRLSTKVKWNLLKMDNFYVKPQMYILYIDQQISIFFSFAFKMIIS